MNFAIVIMTVFSFLTLFFNKGEDFRFLFDLEFEATVTYTARGSNFRSYIAIADEDLLEVYAGCNECDDCSINCAICCGGYTNQSGIEVVLEPNQYYLLLSDISNGIHFGSKYQIEVQCDYRWPEQCDDRCDAFSVSADSLAQIDNVDGLRSDSADIEDGMWLKYSVERLFSRGIHCFEPIKFFILNLCDGDSIADDNEIGADEYDLNALICGFEVISIDGMESKDSGSESSDSSDSNRRRLIDKDDRYSDDVWGVKSSGIYGIRINYRIESEMTFRICLKDVLSDSISKRVQFRRGNTKFLCNAPWVEGLPCLDPTRFVHGAYGNVNGVEDDDVDDAVHRLEAVEVKSVDTKELKVRKLMRWEVFGAMILLILCLISLCGYGLISTTRDMVFVEKKRRGNRLQRVNTDEQWNNECVDEHDVEWDDSEDTDYNDSDGRSTMTDTGRSKGCSANFVHRECSTILSIISLTS